MNSTSKLLLATVAAGSVFGGPAFAQSAPSEVEEVVVTVQKREENLQNVPLSVTAVTAEELLTRQVSTVQGVLEAAPNVQFSQNTGNARIAIRGVGYDSTNTGGEGRVAYHVDGVYFSRPNGALGTMFDVERVEVLRGPQGTLYGRNATAGAINVITFNPTEELSGYGQVSYGSYNRWDAQGAIGGPLSDQVAGRIAFSTVARDGYGVNLQTGQDIDDEESQSVRGKLVFNLTPDFRLLLTGDYTHQDDSSNGNHFFGAGGLDSSGGVVTPTGILLGGVPPDDPRDSSTALQPTYEREGYGFSAQIDWSVGAFDIVSLSSFRDLEWDTKSELSAVSPQDILLTLFNHHEEAEQFSQELRASHAADWGQFTFGYYYFQEDLYGYSALPSNTAVRGAPLPGTIIQGYWAGGPIHTEAWALFGQATFDITDQFSIDVGARYSSETKSISESLQFDLVRPYSPSNPIMPIQFNEDETSWESFDPRLALTYRFSPDVMVYASYSEGFKSGGYNLGGLQPAFDPEEITDYEVGLRADWLDGRLRTNVSAFQYDYTDLQVSIINAMIVRTENAASAQVRGVEAEFAALPVPALELRGSIGYLDATYEEFCTADPARPILSVDVCQRGATTSPGIDLAGNVLTQAPEWTASLAATYTVELEGGDLSFHVSGSAISEVFFNPFNRPEVSQDGYALLNATIAYETDSGWRISAYGRNLTDEFYRTSMPVSTSTVGSPITGTLGPPRTFGVSLRRAF